MLHKIEVNTAFHVISGKAVADILEGAGTTAIDLVRTTYLDHGNGDTHNPDSYFLRFEDKPRNRIIALPATLKRQGGLSGLKWISSFPGNLDLGHQRASAVLVLNHALTGYPFAVLEASRISAMRTAASAVLGAYHLNGENRQPKSISFVGGGIIARTILDLFVADGWAVDRLTLCDLDDATVKAFTGRAKSLHGLDVEPVELEDALTAEIVVLATTVPRPYIHEPVFRPGQILLNISLRDLSPQIIAASNNILDDIEHCLKAETSPDLAVRHYGHRDFITGTIADILTNTIKPDPAKPTVFSPFGLGVLDLALGQWVFEQACALGRAQKIVDFLFEMER